jgi:hypothetical protein
MFLMIFGKVQVQFRTRSRVHNLEFRIRILQEISDPCGSGSTTLGLCSSVSTGSTNPHTVPTLTYNLSYLRQTQLVLNEQTPLLLYFTGLWSLFGG